jgi:hypothetical protein
MTDPNAVPSPSAGAGATSPNNSASSPATNAGHTVPLPELLKERESRQALQAELEALKATVASLASGPQHQPAPATNFEAPAPRDNRAELDELWREDPRKAMQAELMMAINWRDRVEAEVDAQLEGASRRYNDFGSYQGEVRRYLRGIPVEQRNKPGVVDAAYYMVKGQKTEDIIKSEVEARLKKMTSAEFTTMTAGGSSGGGATQGKSLSDEQRTAAAAMGISEVEYMKFIK